MSLTIALYARVSTEGMKAGDGSRLSGQTVDPQLLELREWARRNGATVTGEWTDVMSGTKAARPGLDAMIERCKAGGVDAVVVVKLDRLGRSLLNVVQLVQTLAEHGVATICTTQGIDTRKSNPCGTMMLGVLAAVAEFERNLISERTKAGLVAARARGSVLGAPSAALKGVDVPAVVRKWREGLEPGGYRGLAKELGGCSVSTAHRIATSPTTAEEV